MPYITQIARDRYNHDVDELVYLLGSDAPDGEVNYILTRLLTRHYNLTDAPSYDRINRAVGVLEMVKQELYRRVAAPYEEEKMKINGDVL